MGLRLAAAAPLPLADGVHVLRDSFSFDRQPDGNSVIFSGPRARLVVDTGRRIEHTLAGLEQAMGDLLPASQVPRARDMLMHYLGQHLRSTPERRDRFCSKT